MSMAPRQVCGGGACVGELVACDGCWVSVVVRVGVIVAA
jgi:hypothetical protein